MLYELEPDRSVTGGAWYSGQEFESEFVEILQQQCYRFLVSLFSELALKFLVVLKRPESNETHKFPL